MNKNKTASLRTLYALDHHAEVLKPIAEALQYGLDYSGIMHSLGSSRGGANSNYINTVGHRFYLKGIMRPEPGIEVRTRPRGSVLIKLKNERDVLRFIRYMQRVI